MRGPSRASLLPPGRGLYEFAILFSAVSLLFPVAALLAGVLAVRAREVGFNRWKVALAAAVWCCGLGIALRILLGGRVVP
jgi:hypothetical protein